MRLLLIACFCFLSTSLFAQTTVTGRVASKDSVLSGVSVQVKGGRAVTQTDAQGNFTISAPGNVTLIFTHVGFATLEVPVNNQSNLSVTLQPGGNQLSDAKDRGRSKLIIDELKWKNGWPVIAVKQ